MNWEPLPIPVHTRSMSFFEAQKAPTELQLLMMRRHIKDWCNVQQMLEPWNCFPVTRHPSGRRNLYRLQSALTVCLSLTSKKSHCDSKFRCCSVMLKITVRWNKWLSIGGIRNLSRACLFKIWTRGFGAQERVMNSSGSRLRLLHIKSRDFQDDTQR